MHPAGSAVVSARPTLPRVLTRTYSNFHLRCLVVLTAAVLVLELAEQHSRRCRLLRQRYRGQDSAPSATRISGTCIPSAPAPEPD